MAATAAVAPAGFPAARSAAPAASPKAAPASSSKPSSSPAVSPWNRGVARAKASRGGRALVRQIRKPDIGDLGGFLAGLVGYALFLSYIDYGVDGPKGWIAAKFINKPMTLPAQAAPSTSSGSASSSSFLVGTIPGAGYSTSTAEA